MHLEPTSRKMGAEVFCTETEMSRIFLLLLSSTEEFKSTVVSGRWVGDVNCPIWDNLLWERLLLPKYAENSSKLVFVPPLAQKWWKLLTVFHCTLFIVGSLNLQDVILLRLDTLSTLTWSTVLNRLRCLSQLKERCKHEVLLLPISICWSVYLLATAAVLQVFS